MGNLDGVSRADLISMFFSRINAVKSASSSPVKELDSYPANRLAKELHPDCQHLIIKEIIPFSDDFKCFVFEADKELGTAKPAWFSAGQYIVIPVIIDGKMYCRPYSISSSPRDTLKGEIMIAVKRVEGGIVSGYLLDNLKEGDKILASPPLGNFTYEPLRDAKTVIGIAGGSGITPFRSFARAIAESDEDFNLILLYGSRTLKDAVFSDEIKKLAEENPKIKLVNVLSEEKKKGCEHGFIGKELIEKYAPADEAYSIFLCGPQAMYDFADKEIAKLGIRRKFIRHEVFGEYFHPEKNDDYTADINNTYNLTVRIAGEEFICSCPADTSLLRAMESAGIKAPSDCRSGRCGWCRSQLISGEVYIPESVDGRRLADKEFGYIHPCCSFPLSDIVIDVPPMKG